MLDKGLRTSHADWGGKGEGTALFGFLKRSQKSACTLAYGIIMYERGGRCQLQKSFNSVWHSVRKLR